MSDAVARFRRMTGRKGGKPVRKARPSVPPRETALVGLILLNVLWLAFALGGVRLWGELTAWVLSGATLLLLPRWETGEIHGLSSPVYQLLKLPLFWLGLGLMSVFFIQSWNLEWEWQIVNGRPHLVYLQPLVDWLPTGVMTPIEESNPLRSMIFYSIPWLTCCSAWAGLGTRRSVQRLLHGLAWIGVVFALVALQQHFLDLRYILGLFPELPTRAGAEIPFWGTLHNCNHAAYFLILATGFCLGLFLYGWYRDLRQFKRSGGAWLLYLGLALLTTFSVLMAQARGAIGFVLLQWLLFILICTFFFIRRFGWIGLSLPGLFGLIVLAVGGTFIINPDVFENQKKEWIKTFSLVENPELEARYYMVQIASDMVEDRPWFGHGAGSWRYLHLPYLENYPEFKTKRIRWEKNAATGKYQRRNVTVWFQNAHVDLMEYLVDWGIVGCLFPVMAALWLFYRGLRAFRGWDPGLATLLATVLAVFLGALVEFHFRIPLVLLVWSLMFTLAIKLTELNARAN
jgi:O-antigen ligase